MALLFQSVLAVHVAAGAVALLVFWVPLVTKKGGRMHRRVGWVYVAAAGTLAVTGFLLCIRLVSSGSPLRWRAGIFLAYVSVLAGASAQLGVRALQTKGRAGASRGAIDLVPPLLLVAGGVALAAFGICRSTVLYVLFAGLGVVLGLSHLRFWLTPPAHERAWFLAHMSGMGTSCITTVTAFVVVQCTALLACVRLDLAPLGRPDCRPRRRADDLGRRYYARRFTGNASRRVAPPGSSKSCLRIIAASSRTRRRTVPFAGGDLFARIGGRAAIDTLVDGLYDRIEVDAALRPLFGRDLATERESQKRFFTDGLGGEGNYHPYLPLKHRHGLLPITRSLAGRWVGLWPNPS